MNALRSIINTKSVELEVEPTSTIELAAQEALAFSIRYQVPVTFQFNQHTVSVSASSTLSGICNQIVPESKPAARIYQPDGTYQDMTQEEAERLTKVEGGLWVWGGAKLDVPALTTVEGDLVVLDGATLDVPKLTTVKGNLAVYGTLTAPKLNRK